jgi:hypothetical protein
LGRFKSLVAPVHGEIPAASHNLYVETVFKQRKVFIVGTEQTEHLTVIGKFEDYVVIL